MRVHEFEEGYLVSAVFPPASDVAGRPTPQPPGGGKVVVCKETGQTSTIPNYPTEQAIALYRRNRARPRDS